METGSEMSNAAQSVVPVSCTSQFSVVTHRSTECLYLTGREVRVYLYWKDSGHTLSHAGAEVTDQEVIWQNTTYRTEYCSVA